ncbi:hypothetical protein HPB52_016880 [Rhipicephalus sanguineus]|uniref:Uncharacterized protein n=1 Tax=Rhipicephalus sanguineus TaxID=34632 RepID=A0A9D4QAI5_RHISA|nr:hypothetical protein HPB52_016880 [Rhipicephalus sanguineus]
MCDKVLCQSNATETANTVEENLVQTPSECVATVDLACGVQGYFDPLDKNARLRPEDGATVESTEYNALVDSFQACELGCSEEKNCIVLKRAKLSASPESEGNDDFPGNPSDCAGETVSESANEHQMQAGASKLSPKNRHRRKRRHRARRAAKSPTRLKKGWKRSIVAGAARRKEKKKRVVRQCSQREEAGSPAVLSTTRLMGRGSAGSVVPKK